MPDGADTTKLPIFSEAHADCGGCGLQGQLAKQLTAYAYRPDKFNGLMIIGEGPGHQEVAQGRPFVGPSGKLLRGLLNSVGLDLDECYITNATLCKPPPKDDALHTSFPTAIPSCLGRLEAEIEAVKPRVIVTLGASAFIALSGYDKTVINRVRFDCDNCNANRRVGPALQCNAPMPNEADGGKTSRPCGQLHFVDKDDVDAVAALKEAGCTSCSAKMKRLRPKMVKCQKCGGLKMRSEEVVVFAHDYNMSDVAGGIMEPGEGTRIEQHELDPWLGAQGVRYVIPTYHPAFLMRGQQFMAKAVQKHLAKAKRLLGEDADWRVNYKTTADPEVVREFCWAWKRKGQKAPNFTVDIETEAWGLDSEGVKIKLDARKVRNVTSIGCIGLGGWQLGGALVVDTRKVNQKDPDDPLLAVLYEFLTDDDIPKTYQNGACYDIPVLDLLWGIPWDEQVNSYTDDTLGAHANLYPDEPHKLPHITFSFTDARVWKPARTVKGAEVHGSFEELALYNARDIMNTDASREAMGVSGGLAHPGGKMARAGLAEIYAQDSRMRQVCVSMTMHGMPLNREKFREAGEIADKHVNEAVARARELLDEHTSFENPEEFSWTKPKHLIPALFDPTGFNLMVIAKTKRGVPVTDKNVLQKLMASCKDPRPIAFVKAILEIKEHHRIRSTYIYSDDMQPWADGRIHPIWQPWGTRTGRLSSKPNGQNWPQWLRMVIEAALGRKIVGADYDQLEMRGVALCSGDPELTRRCMTADDQRKLEPDHDPHSFVSSLAFGATYTSLLLKDPKHDKADWKCKCQTCKRKALRDLIKRVFYGMGYGAGDRTVLEAIYSGPGGYDGPPITIEMVAHVRKTIFKAFSQLLPYREKLLRDAQAMEEVRSPLLGRRRGFPLGEIPPTEIYNFPIQSIGADIVNERTIVLYDALQSVDPSAFLFAQGHDSLYAECAEDKADAVADLFEEILPCEKSIGGGPAMKFTAGAAISSNWKDAA